MADMDGTAPWRRDKAIATAAVVLCRRGTASFHSCIAYNGSVGVVIAASPVGVVLELDGPAMFLT